jgi:mercuric ion binding protein
LQDIEQSKENTMKKLIVLAAVAALGTGAAQAAERTVKFSVDKMYCEACPLTVSKAMQGVKGVGKGRLQDQDRRRRL